MSPGRLLAIGLAAGIAAHAAHATLGFGGAAVDRFFDDWLLNGLITATSVACLMRGLRVRAERLAWLVLGAAMLCWSGRIHLLDDLHRPRPVAAVPLARGRAVARLLPRGLRRAGADHPLADPRVPEEPLARRRSSAGSRSPPSASALIFGAVLSSTGGNATQIAVNLAYPLGDMLLVAFVVSMFALDRLATGARRPAAGHGLRAERRRRLAVGLRLRHRHLLARVADRVDLAGSRRA